MYASFLQEASKILNNPELNDLSKEMMEIGDGWREIAYVASRMAKNRDFSREKFLELRSLIGKRADLEESFFTDLRKEILNSK